MRIIVLGPQGSGKGTQAVMLSEKYSIPHISTGDLFRMNLKNKTKLGQTAAKYINKGNLVPDEVTNQMVKQRISEPDCKKGFILDGYPRNLSQAKALSSFVELDAVLDIEISEHETIERLSGRRVCQSCGQNFHIQFNLPKKEGICDKCGGTLMHRQDDYPDAILTRLNIYKKETSPIKQHYEKQGILRTVNGSQSIEGVFTEILFNLRKVLSAQ